LEDINFRKTSVHKLRRMWDLIEKNACAVILDEMFFCNHISKVVNNGCEQLSFDVG